MTVQQQDFSVWFEGHILAIETSCDETSAAVVTGRTIESNIVSSQAELHRRLGGIVPEVAARAHIESIVPVVQEALDRSNRVWGDVDAIAVTNRPGLFGALSVGATFAEGLARARSLPILGIHHLEGHLLSPVEEHELDFPHLSLIASGGHTEIVLVRALGDYSVVSETIDDAAGEALDKCARLLGMGYPGGRAMEKLALSGDESKYAIPIALPKDPTRFSFSGVKTAALRLVESQGPNLDVASAAASIQEAIMQALATKTIALAEQHSVPQITVVGGVAANRRLSEILSYEADRLGIRFAAPSPVLCTDNAGMIGLAASWRFAAGERAAEPIVAFPQSPLP